MKISVLCVTYARVEKLEEMLASFLNQQTEVTKELIILNTYPEQFLVFNHPEVKVINLKERPKTLGEARNQSVMWSNYSHIITVDDDDTILPHHIDNYARLFKDNEWIMPDGFIYTTSTSIEYKRYGIPAALGYTLKAFNKANGYKAMDSGEDQDFNQRIMTTSQGEIVSLELDEISYIYNWDNGVQHVSVERQDGQSGYKTVETYTQSLKDKGLIPTGRIALHPRINDRYSRVLNSPLVNMPS